MGSADTAPDSRCLTKRKMPAEKKVLLVCTVVPALIAVVASLYAARLSVNGASWEVPVALGLGAAANALVSYVAWRGLSGTRAEHPVFLVLKLLSASIFLTLLGPRLLAALTR